MSTVMDTNDNAASEPLVDMAETKDVNLESSNGAKINEAAATGKSKASNDDAINGDNKVVTTTDNAGAINGDNKVAATTDNAGAKSSPDEVSSLSPGAETHQSHYPTSSTRLRRRTPQSNSSPSSIPIAVRDTRARYPHSQVCHTLFCADTQQGAMYQDTPKTTPTAPKKRGAKSDSDGGPPKKKRAAPKSKKVKEEENHEEDGEAGEADVPETPVKKIAARGKGGKGKNKTNGSADPITPPKTPKVKGSVTGGNGFTGSAVSDDDGNEAEASITEGPAITKKGAARKRAPAGKIGNTIAISTSLETASAQDKMLFKMKEVRIFRA